MGFQNLIQTAIDKRATDIHITAGKKCCIRINGSLMEVNNSKIVTAHEVEQMVREILNENQISQLEKNKHLLLSANLYGKGRFRIHISFQRGSYCFNVKLTKNIDHIEDFQFHEMIENLHKIKSGLVLITGASGAGKSVACAKILKDINKHYCRTVVTLENPIEYLFKHEQSIFKQKEIGLDIKDHLTGFKSALQDDTDVIFVDDVSQSGVLEMALQASEKGKLVIGCLTTRDINTTLNLALTGVEVHERVLRKMKLSENLKAVISQKMINDEDGHNIVIYETLLNTPAVKRLIVEDKLSHLSKVLESHKDLGMTTFDNYLNKLVESKVINIEKAQGVFDYQPQVIKKADRVV